MGIMHAQPGWPALVNTFQQPAMTTTQTISITIPVIFSPPLYYNPSRHVHSTRSVDAKPKPEPSTGIAPNRILFNALSTVNHIRYAYVLYWQGFALSRCRLPV